MSNKATELCNKIAENMERLADMVDEAKGSEVMVQYLNFTARFHKYSLNNTFLIWLQCPDATRVAGYKAWQKMGRQVRKGQKGIAILAPMPYRKEIEEEDGTIVENYRISFKVTHVFDVSQTDGDELPSVQWFAEGDEGEELQTALRQYAARIGVKVVDADTGSAVGTSAGGKITLSPKLSPLGCASTLAHELAHELLHQGENSASRPSSEQCEQQAEATAAVAMMHFGYEVPSSANYLALWGADAATLKANLKAVQTAASQIIEGVKQQLAVEQAA